VLFRKKENLDRLLEIVGNEQSELSKLEKALEAAKAQWSKCQLEVENLVSREAAWMASYRQPAPLGENTFSSGGTHDEYYQARGVELRKQIDEAIAKRDALTSSTVAQMRALRDRLSRRRAAITGLFSSWADGVCSVLKYIQVLGVEPQYELSDDIRSELLRDRQAIADSRDDLQLILDRIAVWVERIEEQEVRQPLFRLDAAITKALEVA
jgi:hypothetical protein